MSDFERKPAIPGTIDYLYWKNYHERDQNVTFEEGPHIYTIAGYERGDSTSVTTWNKNHFSEFDPETVAEKIISGKKWATDSTYKYYQMSKEDMIALWKNSGKEASESGTKLHNDIEQYFNGMEVSNDSIEYTYFLKFREDYKHLTPYRTEWMVYHEDLKLVGSIDMIYENPDGDLEIYDWKRSKEIVYDNQYNKFAKTACISHLPDTNFWHYSLQLNTYRRIIQEKYGKKVVGLYLVRFHPDNAYKTYDRINVSIMDNELDELFELRKKELEKST
jgi:ATP-dependent exoDNAse (exonuclease V) beta subunit|uniref:PD-(D/E)XK endonuclease-like domain-containing protein n=1 Tax=viral metagenome TaxID=1070528 RepID=A0A6C0IMH1_9ZZZZ